MTGKSKEALEKGGDPRPDWFILESGRKEYWFPTGNNGSGEKEYWVVTLRRNSRGNITSFSYELKPASEHPKKSLITPTKKAA